MFENKIYEGIHYSRFVASWNKICGKVNFEFKLWLNTLTINGKPIPENVIDEIYNFGTNGKLELEENIRTYLDKRALVKEKKLREVKES